MEHRLYDRAKGEPRAYVELGAGLEGELGSRATRRALIGRVLGVILFTPRTRQVAHRTIVDDSFE